MKKLTAFVLALLMAAAMLPAAANADGIYSTSYGEQFVLGYSWSTGESTGATHAYRIYFKNPAQHSITSYMVTMYFYNDNGEQIGQASSDWQKNTVAYNKGEWTPWVEATQDTAYFTWKLSYHLKDINKLYQSTVNAVADGVANTWLLQCRSWKNADYRAVEYSVPSETALVETSFQFLYRFSFNSSTGAVTESQMYYRTFLKNRGANKISAYDLCITCMDENGSQVDNQITGWQDASLANNKGAWSSWLTIPLTTDKVIPVTSYITD